MINAMDAEQIITRNYRLPIIEPKDSQKSIEDLKSERTEMDPSDKEGPSIFDLGQVDLRALEIILVRSDEYYLIDFSLPSEENVNAFCLAHVDLKVDYLKKTRLALALAASGLTVAMIASLLLLPKPYNLASLALCGPLFVSTYGLLTQK